MLQEETILTSDSVYIAHVCNYVYVYADTIITVLASVCVCVFVYVCMTLRLVQVDISTRHYYLICQMIINLKGKYVEIKLWEEFLY